MLARPSFTSGPHVPRPRRESIAPQDGREAHTDFRKKGWGPFPTPSIRSPESSIRVSRART